METLIVFDGNSLLNRAFYGVRPLSNQAGLPTNAIFGFVNILQKALASVPGGVTYAAMAFDRKEPTFRHKACDFYKANRKGMPEELALQMPYAHEVASALGIRVVELPGYEADDILGTLSEAFSSRGVNVVLVTGDRDGFQLVKDNVKVHLAANQETRVIGVEEVFSLYGVAPKQLVDVKSIMGDSSDNIPGVPGIGEKGACKLIAQYGDLEGVYEHLDEIKGALKEKLRTGKESAHTSRFLAEICVRAPIDTESETYRYTGKNVSRLKELYTFLEFRKLLEQLSDESDDVPACKTALPRPRDAAVGRVSDLSGEAFALTAGESGVIVTDGAKTVLIPWEEASELCALPQKLLFWSVKETLHSFWEHGLEPTFAKTEDLSLLSYLSAVSDSGTSFAGTVFRAFGETIEERPVADLFFLLEEKLRSGLNEKQISLYETMEKPLAFVLADMERVGFSMDREKLAAFTRRLGEEIALLEREIAEIAGHPFNPNSPKQLGEVLFEERNLPHFKKNKSGYSTDVETLEKLSFDPLVRKVLEYRKATKLKSTYGDGLLKVISADGRVHTTFKQTQTQTGRLSSAEPNLQNIPVRTEKGRELRRFFVASEGGVLIDADYSQIELRLLAHLSGDEALCEAFREGKDIHTATAASVFGVPLSEVTPEMRKSAKAVNFGIIYGIGKYSLSQDIGVSVREADAYINNYFARYPRIKAYMDGVKAFAAEHHYVETAFGRRRDIPELAQTNKVKYAFGERVAMNTPIQGTAADLIKLAMIRVSASLKEAGLKAKLVLQIHDELIVDAPKEEAERAREILQREMENAFPISVPLVAEAGIGESWFDAKI